MTTDRPLTAAEEAKVQAIVARLAAAKHRPAWLDHAHRNRAGERKPA